MMNEPIDADRTLNEWVHEHPECLSVFTEFGLDTCCGGALPLRDAAARHGIELEKLLSRLLAQTRPQGAPLP